MNNVNISTQSDLRSFYQIPSADTFITHVINYLDNGNKLDIENTELLKEIEDYLNKERNLKFAVIGKVLQASDMKIKPIVWRIVIPDSNKFIQLQLTQLFHNIGHSGYNKLYQTMKSKFYWSQMFDFLKNFVGSCSICQKTKRKN